MVDDMRMTREPRRHIQADHVNRARSSDKRLPRAIAPSRIALYVAAVAFGFFTLFPMYWAFVTAFRDPDAILGSKSLLPIPFSLENFNQLLLRNSFATFTLNSAIVATAVTLITLVVSLPAAYMLVRVESRLLTAVALLTLVAYMFPEILAVIPTYIALARIGLDNTLTGLIIGLLPAALPLAIWLMSSYIRSFPFEIEEAGVIDGASRGRVFVSIVLPNLKSGVITVGLFSFILAWTDYLVGVTFIYDDKFKTLPVGLAGLFGQFEFGYGQIMGGVLFLTAPVLVLLASTGRYFTLSVPSMEK